MVDLMKILNKNKYRYLIKKDPELIEQVLSMVSWTTDIDEAIHCLKNNITAPPLCEICNDGSRREFKKKNDGTMHYTNGCCLQHARISTNRKKYGVDNPSQSPEIKEKKKETTIKNFGVAHNSQSPEIKEKKKETTIKNFGVTSPLQNAAIMEKVQRTNIDRYGVTSPLQNVAIMEKVQRTNIDRYGVKNPQQNRYIRQKTEKTCFKKFNGSNPMCSDEVKDKIRKTFKKSFFFKKMNSISHIVEPLFDLTDYTNTTKVYAWKCKKCDDVFGSHLINGTIPRCHICYPRLVGVSRMEMKLFEDIKDETKQQANRSILKGKELDIYLPDHELAIEFNGIYWHSELNGKDKKYHLNKTLECQEQNIQLIHIFESEWIEKQEIVRSIINSKMGQFEQRLFARKCRIEEIPPHMKNHFLDENHLQGKDKSSIKLGLFHENELISVMTFGKSRYNKKIQYEMYRFCSKQGYQIIGGASKLLKYFIRKYSPKSIITYADRRYSDGSFYEKIGFKKLRASAPNYFYFKGHSGLMSRIQFQKHKLKDKLDSFDPKLTEWENMQLNGYDRIWDCGNFVYVMML